MRLDRGDDAAPHRQRADPSLPDRLDQRGRRRLAQQLLLATHRTVQQCAVLGDHPLEQVDPREDAQQLVELPPGDQNQPPPRVAESLQGRQGFDSSTRPSLASVPS